MPNRTLERQRIDYLDLPRPVIGNVEQCSGGAKLGQSTLSDPINSWKLETNKQCMQWIALALSTFHFDKELGGLYRVKPLFLPASFPTNLRANRSGYKVAISSNSISVKKSQTALLSSFKARSWLYLFQERRMELTRKKESKAVERKQREGKQKWPQFQWPIVAARWTALKLSRCPPSLQG